MSNFNVRKGVFETNSSSAHTFVLTKSSDYVSEKDIIKSERYNFKNINGKRYFKLKENYFGSSFALITTWDHKLRYLFSSLATYDYYRELLIEFVKKELPNCAGVIMDVPDWYLDDEKGDLVAPESDNILSGFGYVDHQSTDTGYNFLKLLHEKVPDKTTYELLKEIVFCNKYFIVTDSDGLDTFKDFYNRGVFSVEKVDYLFHESYIRNNDTMEWEVKFELLTSEDFFNEANE